MPWLEGFDRIDADKLSGAYIDAPWRIVLHTTEGSSTAGAIAAYRASGSWPHFTVDPALEQRAQHIDTDRSARALMHPTRLPETNRARAVQIEIVGFATTIALLADDRLEWLARQVIGPIRAVCPVDLTAPLFVPYPSSYGFGAAQRFTAAQWDAFHGVCGHQHVPGNDHGDPGAINITKIFTSLQPVPPPAPTPKGADMAGPATETDSTGRRWVFWRGTDGALWARVNNGDPFTLGGNVTDQITAHAGPNGTMDVYAYTPDGTTWGRHDNGATWDPWYPLA